MTYNYRIENCVFERNSTTSFSSVFSAAESDDLIVLCKNTLNRNFTNGRCVRADYCKQTEQGTLIGLSEVNFYDFLLSNLSLFNFEKLLHSATKSQSDILLRLRDRFDKDGPPDSVESILRRNYLANTLAISLLIQDLSGRFLLTKRNNSVGISNGFVSVTVTGAVDECDYLEQNPFCNCCQREMLEEMNYSIDPSLIQPFMIVCGENKLQPIVLANAIVHDISEVVSKITLHRDFVLENSGYSICSREDLHNILLDDSIRITEAARTHLESVLKGYETAL